MSYLIIFTLITYILSATYVTLDYNDKNKFNIINSTLVFIFWPVFVIIMLSTYIVLIYILGKENGKKNG